MASELDIDDDETVLSEIAFTFDVDEEDLSVTDARQFRNVSVREVRLGRNNWFLVFADEDAANEAANEYVKDLLESDPESFDQDWLSGHFDQNKLKKAIREVVEEDDYASEIASSEPERFWKEAETLGIDIPEEDEDGNLPDEIPDDKIEHMAEILVERKMKDPEGYLNDMLGEKEAKKWLMEHVGFDVDAAASEAVSTDGWQHFLASVDGNSYTTAGGFVYVQTSGNSMGRDAPSGIPEHLEPL